MKNEITVQKLFNIHYNKKVFTIFLCENGRKTFLELSNGKYIYPLLDNFINLHKIYNGRNPFVSYYNIGDRLPKKLTFRECVIDFTKVISVVLAGVISYNSFISFALKKNNDKNVLEVKSTYVDNSFDDTRTLDTYLGRNYILEEDLIAAINNNPNFDDAFKEKAIMLAKYIKEKYPNTDNRIFYDNIKTLKVYDLEDNNENKYIGGSYNSHSNVIKIKNNIFEDETIFHELAHSYHNWASNKQDEDFIYRSEKIGYSIDEAMINKLISGITNVTSYQREEKILDYLLTLVDYNYYDYEQGGITKLYNMLKEKYPLSDIDYIFNCSDAMTRTYSKLGESIKIEESPEFLDAIFDLCIHSINQNDNLYIHILNFLNLIDCNTYSSIAENYINKYNQILKEMGYDIFISNEVINDANLVNNYLNTFKNYLSKTKFNYSQNPKSKKEMYEQLNNYFSSNNNLILAYNNNNLLFNIFIETLNIYNDFLISNGYLKEDLITKEDFLNNFSRYLNITIKEYCITKDDELYLIIDIPENNKLYNQDKRVSVLNKEGKITLINVEDIVLKGDIKYKYQFISYIFNNITNNTNYNINELLTNYLNISPYKYKKISLTINGKKIEEDYLKNLNVTIGENIDGTNYFKLSDKKGKIIYETENSSSKFVTLEFYDYVKYFIDTYSIELNEYLTTDYIIQLLNYGDFEMTNKEYLKIDDNKVIIENPYYAILDNDYNKTNKHK